MPRNLRPQFEDAIYHVMNRGGGKQVIFHDDTQRRCFLDLLREIYERYTIAIMAYCLMGNHYHLLVQTPRGNIADAMQYLDGVYTKRFNKAMHTDGSLFRGRYHAIPIESEAYLINVSRYIHLNPKEAGLVEKPEDYRWSSYGAYIGTAAVPEWLDREMILSKFHSAGSHKEYVDQGNNPETLKFYDDEAPQKIMGGEQFKASIVESMRPGVVLGMSKIYYETCEGPSIELVLEVVAEHFSITVDELTYGRKRGAQAAPRLIAVYLCRKMAMASTSMIAKRFGYSKSGCVSVLVAKLKKKMENSNDWRSLLDDVRAKICKVGKVGV